jgi:hypothetical protein
VIGVWSKSVLWSTEKYRRTDKWLILWRKKMSAKKTSVNIDPAILAQVRTLLAPTGVTVSEAVELGLILWMERVSQGKIKSDKFNAFFDRMALDREMEAVLTNYADARNVKGESWISMLSSIRNQLAIVAKRSRRQKEDLEDE